MLSVWFLTQHYIDETGWMHPVAYDYGQHFFCPVTPATPDEWALVRVAIDVHQIEAAKQDPRLIYCGREYNTPPPKLLEVYASKLDPGATYAFFGQVLATLAETEPNYYRA